MQKTDWGHESNWYNNIAKGSKSNHQLIIFPKLLEIISNIDNKVNILDLACGNGILTNILNNEGYNTVGIDLAKELINIAKDNKGKYYIENAESLSNSFKKEYNKYFNIVLSILAIQNISNFNSVLNQLNAITKKNSRIIIVINHPCFRIPKESSWGFNGHVLQYRIINKYMSQFRSEIIMHPGSNPDSKTISFHRPLEYYVNNLSNNGYLVENIYEWISNKKSEKGLRQIAEDNARKEIPLFMCIKAIKTEN